jgi:hypothetical protein
VRHTLPVTDVRAQGVADPGPGIRLLFLERRQLAQIVQAGDEHHQTARLGQREPQPGGNQPTLTAGQVPVPDHTRERRDIQQMKQQRIHRPRPAVELAPRRQIDPGAPGILPHPHQPAPALR